MNTLTSNAVTIIKQSGFTLEPLVVKMLRYDCLKDINEKNRYRVVITDGKKTIVGLIAEQMHQVFHQILSKPSNQRFMVLNETTSLVRNNKTFCILIKFKQYEYTQPQRNIVQTVVESPKEGLILNLNNYKFTKLKELLKGTYHYQKADVIGVIKSISSVIEIKGSGNKETLFLKKIQLWDESISKEKFLPLYLWNNHAKKFNISNKKKINVIAIKNTKVCVLPNKITINNGSILCNPMHKYSTYLRIHFREKVNGI